MLIKRFFAYFLMLLCICSTYSQSKFSFAPKQHKETVKFQFISNLMIIPVEVNGVELSFVLDTGVSKPVLFNLSDSDSLEIKNVEEVFIKGLGDGKPVKAFRSRGNRFKINKMYNNEQELYVVLDKDINFSPQLGIPVHGIIGADLFKDFVVEVKYTSKKLKFYDAEKYNYKKCKKCKEFPLQIIQDKPYVDVHIDLEGKRNIPVKLLIDSGSSEALWLFENEEKNLKIPNKSFEDFLGRGLSGSIYGDRARVDNLHIGNFVLKDAKVAFPDAISIQHVNMSSRNGSLGAEVLKRFNVVFDYPNRKITLRKNGNFKLPFKYNMSGIELQHNGIRFVKELASTINGVVQNTNDPSGNVEILLTERYKITLQPAFEIAEIRKESPAALAGLQKGDIILSVNGKQTHRYSLQEVSEMLNEKPDKKIKLMVDRSAKILRFAFTLKKVL